MFAREVYGGVVKKVFILWSGGLDSTFAIYELLRNNYHVTAGYVNILNNQSTKYELSAIKKMLNIFNKDKNFSYIGNVLEIRIKKVNNESLFFQQLPVFLMAALYSIPKNTDFFVLGYVMNDDAVSYKKEILNTWEVLSKLCDDDFKTELWTPLIKMKKSYMYKQLPEEIKKDIVWCESIKMKKNKIITCNECPSCLRHNEIIKSLSTQRRGNDWEKSK